VRHARRGASARRLPSPGADESRQLARFLWRAARVNPDSRAHRPALPAARAAGGIDLDSGAALRGVPRGLQRVFPGALQACQLAGCVTVTGPAGTSLMIGCGLTRFSFTFF